MNDILAAIARDPRAGTELNAAAGSAMHWWGRLKNWALFVVTVLLFVVSLAWYQTYQHISEVENVTHHNQQIAQEQRSQILAAQRAAAAERRALARAMGVDLP